MAPMRIDAALQDRNLLGAALGDPATWAGWLAVLKAAFGIPLSEAEQSFFETVSGRARAPVAAVAELWAIIGRRSGKSRIAAAVAAWTAVQPHRLSPGETGVVMVLSATTAQARVVFNYCVGFLESAPMLRQEVDSATAGEIRLRNGVVIEVRPNNYRTVRGRTILGAIFDETAHWRDDRSANPDVETYRAVLPSLAATGGMLIGISTPYSRRGLLHDRFRRFFGQDDESVLVVQGKSVDFNSTLSQKMIDKAFSEDPEAAGAEWLGEFRADIASFLGDEAIEAAIDIGRPLELPPRHGVGYFGFMDASGGRSDSYTTTIGHKEGERFVADLVVGRAPKFNPAEVTANFAETLREYGARKVTGDNYGGDWVADAWRSQGMSYERSDKCASDLYKEMLPMFNRGLMSIPDIPPLIRELRALELRTSRMGRDQISHPPGLHDDHANALAGCLRATHARDNRMIVMPLRGGF